MNMEQKPECKRWGGQQLLPQQVFKKVFHSSSNKSLDTEVHIMKTMTVMMATVTNTKMVTE